MSTRRQPSRSARFATVVGLSLALLAGMAGQGLANDDLRTASATGVSVSDIQSVMGQHRITVRSCVVGETLPVRVDIVVDFVIDLDGTVQAASIVESNAGQPVDSCVLEVFDSIEFPEPVDGRTFTVRYPMIFVTGN